MDRSRKRKSYSQGRWAVARERLHIPEWYPPAPPRDPVAVSKVVPSLMAKLGLAEAHWLGVLADRWADVVGEEVARHSRPGRFENGTLIVFVDSSVWLSELQRYGKKIMLAKVREQVGNRRIRSVVLRLEPDGPHPSR